MNAPEQFVNTWNQIGQLAENWGKAKDFKRARGLETRLVKAMNRHSMLFEKVPLEFARKVMGTKLEAKTA